jgi:E2F-associated phosphoprotein
MEGDNNNINNRVDPPDHHGAMMAVVSGDSEGPSDEEDIFETSDARSHDNDDDTATVDSTPQGDGFLYDENLDEEDEAYVYHNLRGGKHEPKPSHAQSKDGSSPNVQKPRNSDAVLSCPCCFRILSLDTQKHHKYHNQFRAMFVMGISVDWQHMLKYDDQAKGLVRYYPTSGNLSSSNSQVVAPDHPSSSSTEQDPIYYSVHCAGCQTQVAALDMSDEVYHFYDCLASA